jgi:hypothetical protein
MAGMYDYLFFDAATGASPFPRAALTVRPLLENALAGTPGQVLGVFAPQLGWTGSQTAVLLRWPGDNADRTAAIGKLTGAPTLKSVTHDVLTPTARPSAGAVPHGGGIYVHRWFVIEASAVDEFVELSQEGWRDFEDRFDADIYGLFAARRTDEDQKDAVTRLLLLTRYGDHGVWETSRDPTTTAMQAFARRQAVTRVSWAASSLLVDG